VAEGGKALRHGSAEEVELRSLVGGAVYRIPQCLSLFGGASSEVRRCNCSVVV
jgi:hypothetical protein